MGFTTNSKRKSEAIFLEMESADVLLRADTSLKTQNPVVGKWVTHLVMVQIFQGRSCSFIGKQLFPNLKWGNQRTIYI
jgi:hypothetical protein